MLLAEILRKTGAEIPDRIAYVAADGWPVTYRELDQLSDEVAVGQQRELGPGADVLHRDDPFEDFDPRRGRRGGGRGGR